LAAVKFRSITILMLAEIGAMALWFISAAVLPAMLLEADVSTTRQAALSSGVQAGFVVGAMVSAFFGLSDRYDPRRVFAICAIAAAAANLALVWTVPGGNPAILMRFITGAALAGVYPVGMKIVVGWSRNNRGLLVGTMVGALTLGSALPHLFSFFGGTNWRVIILIASATSCLAGLACLWTHLGPYHSKSLRFDPRSVLQAWTNKRVRYAYLGYFGHMWELYAMWAWIGAISLASYSPHLQPLAAQNFSTLTAFIAIAAGAPVCIIAGSLADRLGKEKIAIISMVMSGSCALLAALTFGGPVWISFFLFVLWGIAIIPDSALFSALVADAAPPEHVGSLMTLQTAIGFALTFFTVQLTPVVAIGLGWPTVLVLLALGPAVGIYAMMCLRRLSRL
jgi:MFS family permease